MANDWKRLPKPAPGPCPPVETVASFVAGTLDAKESFLDHLAACAACRDDVAAARAEDASPAPAGLRMRLYRLLPARRSLLPRLAIAAAIVVAAVVGAVVFWPSTQDAPPITVRPPKPAPKAPDPKPEPTPEPEPPKPAPKPEPAPEPVKPAPPAPTPEPPVVPKPVPAPEKPPAPAPEPPKPAPEPTRVAMKGSAFSIAGSATAQAEGEAAAQPLRAGQKREFAGTLRLKADVAATKVAIGSVTCYLQRGGELTIGLEEGRTRAQLVKGEAFFDVIPGRGQVVVETAQAKVTVKGTRFLVSAEKAETEVFLQKGAVEFAAAEQTVALSPGERSAAAAGRVPSPPQKADFAKRLAWLKPLEDTIVIEADQMALQGGMTVLPDPTALGGRAIGVKAPLKAGQEAVAEFPARRKQPVPYAVWIRLHWGHGVPSAATLSVGDAFSWSSKGVIMSQNWQWVRAGTTELADERFRVRLTDTQPGLRVDQILITSDPELNPETK
jgi:outer membrane biosynthesis protein TonB